MRERLAAMEAESNKLKDYQVHLACLKRPLGQAGARMGSIEEPAGACTDAMDCVTEQFLVAHLFPEMLLM